MSAPAQSPDRNTGDRVSLHRLVTALEVAGVWHQARGDRVYFRCPLPDHEDRDASASADWHPPAGGKPGQVRFQCHRCGRDRNGEVVAALGLTWTDLYDDAPARPAASSPRAGRPRPAPTAPSAPEGAARVDKSAAPQRVPTMRTTRVFTDADGTERFRLHRYDPIPDAPGAAEADKGFAWEHRGGPRGGWRRGKRCKPGQECPACGEGRTPALVPLYRLREVTAAAAAGARVWITEGGRNVDDLAAVLPAGEVATTGPDGARAPWSASYTDVLAGSPVTIVADRDEPGYAHASTVAKQLRAAGCVVRVVRTPLETAHADVSDHLAAGLALSDLEDVPPDVATAAGVVPAEDAEGGLAPVGDLDARRIEKSEGTKKANLSQARRLLDLALELYEPIQSEAGEAYLVPHQGPRVARPLRGGQRSFSAELATLFYERTGSVVGHYATTDVLRILQGMAERTTPVPLPTRVARHEDGLVLDLGDETGRAVVVTGEGWQVVDESPVLFRRTVRTGALPAPERGGSVEELWRLVHVRPADRLLAEAELVHRYFPEVSHPLPLLTGEAGTGKTSAAETLTGLVDPSPAPVISLPTDPRDWAVQIGQAYSLVLDNVWNLQQWQSDALCMAVTGGHSQYRQLYTDGGLSQFGGQQCITLTSIDLGAQKADLTTRLLPIELQPFPRGARMSEGELKAARVASRARILGALLDRVAAVLRALPEVDQLGLDLPRLSDFARVCKALDLLDGADADRYSDYLRLVSRQAGDIADDDEVAATVVTLVHSRENNGQGPWSGTTAELHDALTRTSLNRSRYWPETPVALGKRLSSVVGPLREAGITVERSRTGGRRTITLYRTPAEPTPVEEAGAPAVEPSSSAGCPDGTDTCDEPAPCGDTHFAADVGGQSESGCAQCRAPMPWCGYGWVAGEGQETACVCCGQPTLVRAHCGAPRHANCHRSGGETQPDIPAPTPPCAEHTPPQGERPHQQSANNGGQAHRARTSAGPRRGLHLYGVLDGETLTVIIDRHAGPAETLERQYPRTVKECASLARRFGLEAVWVHHTALTRMGLPAELPDDENQRDRLRDWQVIDRDEPDQVELAVPAWMGSTSSWAEARTGRELATALAAYEAAIGLRFRVSPAAVALSLVGMLHKRHGARPLVTPTALPPTEVCSSERGLSWARPLTEQEAACQWMIGLDKHGAHLGTLKDLTLGTGNPEYHAHGQWDPTVPGRHRITDVTSAAQRNPLLPDPLVGVARENPWRCTETLRYAEEQGVSFRVVESYTWPDSGKHLASFGQRMRTGRDTLRHYADTDEPATLALQALKETYAALSGALASRTAAERDVAGSLYRPDWSGTVIAKPRVNLLRNLDKTGAVPFAANVDELFFAVDNPSPEAIGLPLGDSLADYGIKTAPVLLSELSDALNAAGRRGRPEPLLRALRQRDEKS